MDALNLHNTLTNDGLLEPEDKADVFDSDGDSSVESDDDGDDDVSVGDSAEETRTTHNRTKHLTNQ